MAMRRKNKRSKPARGAAPAGVPSAEALLRAATDAQGLRSRGKPREARRVAEKALAVTLEGSPHRARLALEAALAAFAAGDDEGARRNAGADPRAVELMAPLLAAAAGDEVPLPSRGEPPLRRALGRACLAVAAARRGDVDVARSALRGVPKEHRGMVGTGSLGPAATLAAATRLETREEKRTLSRATTELWRGVRSPEVTNALVRELAPLRPDEAFERGKARRASEEAMRAATTWRRMGATSATDPVDRALALAGAAGAAAFDPAHRASALLYEGFALATHRRRAAIKALNDALAAGADLSEVYRARLLVELGNPRPCPDCGVPHGAGDPAEVAAAADRLAGAYARHPDGAALAGHTMLKAAEWWLEALEQERARASLARGRQLAPPDLQASFDAVEAEMLVFDDPDRSEQLLEKVLEQEPGNVDAWSTYIEAAVERGDDDLYADRLTRAAAATGDPELRREAARLARRMPADDRSRRSPDAPLSPGAVAWDLAHAISGAGRASLPPGEALREELGAPSVTRLSLDHRVAVLAAAFMLVRHHGVDAPWLLDFAIEACGDDVRAVQRVVCAAAYFQPDERIARRALTFASAGKEAAALAVIEGLCDAGQWQTAQRALFSGVSASLGRAVLERAHDAVATAQQHARARGWMGAETVPAALAPLAVALAPELDLFDHEDDETDAAGPSGAEVIAAFLSASGVPPQMWALVPPERVAALEREAETIFGPSGSLKAQHGFTHTLMAALSEAVGVPPPGKQASRPAAPKLDDEARRKQRNKRKQGRRKGR